MSIARKPLIVAATSIAALFLASAAQAAANGGAQAPSAPLSGGSEYGLSAATRIQHPMVTSLSVPSTSVPGRPPRVTLRIDEPHVGTVNATVAVNDLSTRRAAIVVHMGWVHTGRTLSVPWPRGATLKAGSYHVSVSARDHHRSSLMRSAHSSGVMTLMVAAAAAAPTPAPAPVSTPPTPVVEPGVPSPAQTVASGAVFPVAGAHNFGGPENRYGAPRSGHVHEGQDILTAEGTPDVAPLAGTVTTTGNQAAGAGYYAVEHTLVGFDLVFDHCQAATLAVSAGQALAAGQTLCLAGRTGDASAPHLHFEMWVGGWYAPGGHTIDPLPYLEAWEQAGR
jgi:murein DD-endopeptidase MepM/ murein hydrolase activator NlpD